MLAHREGRTRSLQIAVMLDRTTRHKSLTLYPIELGGQYHLNSRDVHAVDATSILFPCSCK